MPFSMGNVAAMMVDLEPGQSWDDEVSLTMTRTDAHALLAVSALMLQQMSEGIDDAAKAAGEGSLTAILLGPKLVESYTELMHATHVLVQNFLPAFWAEIEDVRSAEKAEREATTTA